MALDFVDLKLSVWPLVVSNRLTVSRVPGGICVPQQLRDSFLVFCVLLLSCWDYFLLWLKLSLVRTRGKQTPSDLVCLKIVPFSKDSVSELAVMPDSYSLPVLWHLRPIPPTPPPLPRLLLKSQVGVVVVLLYVTAFISVCLERVHLIIARWRVPCISRNIFSIIFELLGTNNPPRSGVL